MTPEQRRKLNQYLATAAEFGYYVRALIQRGYPTASIYRDARLAFRFAALALEIPPCVTPGIQAESDAANEQRCELRRFDRWPT